MRNRHIRLITAALVAASCRPPAPSIEPAQALGATGGDARSRVVVDSARGEVVLYAGPFRVPDMSEARHQHRHMTVPTGLTDSMRHVGAVAAPAAASGMGEHAVHAYSPLVRFDWPVAGWYRGFRYSLVDAQGRALPRSLMHHLTGVDFDRRQLVNGEAQRFIAAGPETSEIVLPRLLGVPMNSGQKLGVYAAWHNTIGKDFDGVYIRIAMPYTAASAGIKPLSAFPVYMDVNDIAGESNAFDVPPGHSEQKVEFTIPLDGHFLAVGGHLHDYGRDVRLEDAQSGKVLVKLDAVRDTADHLLSMPTRYFLPLGLRVLGGHRYRVVGEYESAHTTTLVQGGMALIVGLFVPKHAAQWPAADPNDPEMVADLASLPGGARALAPVIGAMQAGDTSAAAGQKRPR